MNQQFQNFHNELVSSISKIDGISNVRDFAVTTNKYGDVTSDIFFDVNKKGEDYTVNGRVHIAYEIKQVFIPNRGYTILDTLDVNEVVKQIKDYYKI